MTRFALLVVAGSVSAVDAAAQTLPTISTQQEAQQVVARAVEAAGGIDALRRLMHAEISIESRQATAVGQAANPSAAIQLAPAQRATINVGGARAVYRTYNGENPNYRYVHGPGAGWVHFIGPNTLADVEPLAAAALFDRVTLSGQVLLDLLDRPASFRSLGEHLDHDRRSDVITYVDPLGQQRTLYFDAGTGRLTRAETLTSHAQYGDIANSVSYADYRDVDGAQVAHAMTVRQGSEITAESVVLSLRVGTSLDESLLERPEDANDGPPVTAPATVARTVEAEALGHGIHFVPDAAPGYNAMFVGYEDGVLVLETPVSPQAASDLIDAVKATYPAREIRWAVPTHYHFDHSGGVFGFVRNGTTIVTTEGNGDFVREVASAPRTVGQVGGHRQHALSLETFAGRRTFGEGEARVELIDVGPNPHVDEIVVAYFPGIKALFVADLYGFNGTVQPANANHLALADRLEELDLDVERFIPVHGQTATAEQFWEAVRLGREAAN